jgi:hypothetical protein
MSEGAFHQHTRQDIIKSHTTHRVPVKTAKLEVGFHPNLLWTNDRLAVGSIALFI